MSVLEVTELTVSYGGLVAVDDVSFAIEPGEIVGLIGPNGAGKTTCIDAITGFTQLRSGTVGVDGVDVTGDPPHRRARRGLTRTFQSVELFEDLSVGDNLAAVTASGSWWSPLADMVRPGRARPDVDWALEIVGLGDRGGAMPTDLSHGQRRLVGVARALVARPRVVLLDEPAAGLDPSETEALADVIRRIPDIGAATLLVDHDMTLVLSVCSRVAVLDFGQLIAFGPPDVIRNDPAVVSAYLGGAQ